MVVNHFACCVTLSWLCPCPEVGLPITTPVSAHDFTRLHFSRWSRPVCVCERACVRACVWEQNGTDVCLHKPLGSALSAAATHAVISDFLQQVLVCFFTGHCFVEWFLKIHRFFFFLHLIKKPTGKSSDFKSLHFISTQTAAQLFGPACQTISDLKYVKAIQWHNAAPELLFSLYIRSCTR